jgi:hypothetical protein
MTKVKKQYHRDKANEIAKRNRVNKDEQRLKLIKDKKVYKNNFELMFGFEDGRYKFFCNTVIPRNYRGTGATLNGSKY